MAGIEIVTKQDLIDLEERLISEIRKTNGTGEEPKKLLKSYQVKNLLKISPGTLQNPQSKRHPAIHQGGRDHLLQVRRYHEDI